MTEPAQSFFEMKREHNERSEARFRDRQPSVRHAHWVPRRNGLQPRRTFASMFPLRRIDHILVSHHLHVERVRVLKHHFTLVASDHLPVCADLVLNRECGIVLDDPILRASGLENDKAVKSKPR